MNQRIAKPRRLQATGHDSSHLRPIAAWTSHLGFSPTSPLNADLQNSVMEFYQQYGSSFSRHRQTIWGEERVIAEYVRPGMCVADIGAGNGRLAQHLPPNTNYIGVEPSASLREAAPPHLNLQPGTLPHLPLKDGQTDITVCLAVLHHIPSNAWRESAVGELVRITKPEGKIFASAWFIDDTKSNVQPIPLGEPGDLWIPWKAEGANAKRFVHAMQGHEWMKLWKREELEVERIGLFGKDDWTTDQKAARNWFVIARKKN